MLSRTRRLDNNNGAGSLLFKSLFNYCTTTQVAQSHNGVLVDYLINSLGFSKEAAISASNKVIRSKTIRNEPVLVVNYLENLGLTKVHIRSMVSVYPKLLFYNVDKTLVPKIKFLQELGFSGSDLVKFITAYKAFLKAGLDYYIKPRIDYLRRLLGSDDKVVFVLKRYCLLLLNYDPERVERNILLMRKYGINNENISKMIVKYPRWVLGTNTERVQDKLQRVENNLGIPRESTMFIYGFHILNSFSQLNIDGKFGILRSYGWSDKDVLKMVRIQPLALKRSEDGLRRTLDYLMTEIGYNVDYLASHPVLFTIGLERRVKPRNEVLKILNEKKLNKRKAALITVLKLPESKFMKDYILPYKDKLPDMYEAYMKNLRRWEVEC